MEKEIETAIDDAITDLYGVQFCSNTPKEAIEARREVEKIIRALGARLTKRTHDETENLRIHLPALNWIEERWPETPD